MCFGSLRSLLKKRNYSAEHLELITKPCIFFNLVFQKRYLTTKLKVVFNYHQFQVMRFLFQVSWIRQHDSHILTVDGMTFISDDRFQILKGDRKNSWTLRIRFEYLFDRFIYYIGFVQVVIISNRTLYYITKRSLCQAGRDEVV